MLDNLREEVEAYLLSCTNPGMIEVIEELERRLKKPVITTNQVMLWACLRRLDITEPITGLGQLFMQQQNSSIKRQKILALYHNHG